MFSCKSLYYKTLQICNICTINSLHRELVFLLLSVTFTSSDTTLSMTTLATSSTQHNVMLKILSYCYVEYNLSESTILTVMLNAILLSVGMLNDVMLNVVAPTNHDPLPPLDNPWFRLGKLLRFIKASKKCRLKRSNLQQRFCRSRRIFECLRDPDDHPRDVVQALGQLRRTSPDDATVGISWRRRYKTFHSPSLTLRGCKLECLPLVNLA